MGLIEAWIEVLVFKHVSILATTLIVSSILAFVVLKGGDQKQSNGGIYTVQDGKKIINYEAVLVGAPEEKTWSWLAEIRAKFRYMGEGHHLMYAAFKRVRLPFPFVNTPRC